MSAFVSVTFLKDLGSNKKGDVQEMPTSTAEALKVHKIVSTESKQKTVKKK